MNMETIINAGWRDLMHEILHAESAMKQNKFKCFFLAGFKSFFLVSYSHDGEIIFDTDNLPGIYAASFVASWEFHHLLDLTGSCMHYQYMIYLKRKDSKPLLESCVRVHF